MKKNIQINLDEKVSYYKRLIDFRYKGKVIEVEFNLDEENLLMLSRVATKYKAGEDVSFEFFKDLYKCLQPTDQKIELKEHTKEIMLLRLITDKEVKEEMESLSNKHKKEKNKRNNQITRL
ncbi:MAG: hypothetical protein ACK5HS_04520 [Mycoplasmatales bacterium]